MATAAAAAAAFDEEAERVFSWTPRSFGMDRRSRLATDLRAAVSEKLFHFLGNYSDDVLAEYIVVLVCNGKHQYQAQEDLEAFLGDDSGKFVAWLWDHLSKETTTVEPHLSSSTVRAQATNGNNSNFEEEKSHFIDASLSKSVLHETLNNSRNLPRSSTADFSESHQICSLTSAEANVDGSPQQTHGNLDKVDPTDEKCRVARRWLSSSLKYSPENLTGGEQCFGYESEHQKICPSNSNAAASRSFPILKSELGERSILSITQEDHQLQKPPMISASGRRMPSKAIDGEVPHVAPRRGNVWDRLGKPGTEDDILIKEKEYAYGHNGEHKKPKMMLVEPDTVSSHNLSKRLAMVNEGSSEPVCGSHDKVCTPNSLETSKRKRQSGQIDSGNNCSLSAGVVGNDLLGAAMISKSDKTLLAKHDIYKSSNKFTPEAKNPSMLMPSPANPLRKSSGAARDSEPGKSTQPLLEKSSIEANPLPLSSTEAKGATIPVIDEMLDVKSKLRQVEMNMLKLRSKQVQMSDVKQIAYPGVQNHLDEDPDLRTVLVTNVHFGATKEALFSHFTKCGPVFKVVILTDTVTAQPKGAAYIVFASKESVGKALSLSGTSFFSRVLTVMRKVDTPPGFLVPVQPPPPSRPPFQSWYSQAYQKPPSYQRHCTSPHLQWRRGQSVGSENSLPPATNKLESSNAGE